MRRIVADSGEDDVGDIAGAAFEIAAEVSFRCGGAAAQFALDDTDDDAPLAGDENAGGFCASWP